jgi:WD40 repeat protein
MTARPRGNEEPQERDEKLFVSYAREDLVFVARLAAALESQGFVVWVDTADLYVGEEFWERICTEIDRSTAVVCVVSESFARSEYCAREFEHAASRRKRILPIVVDGVAARHLPEPIRVRHWLPFTEGDPFEQSLFALVAAVRQDPEWIREHTRLLVRAVEWSQRGRSASLCLRGRELDEAIAWLEGAAGKDPPIDALHASFIEASREEDANAQERAERESRISRSRALTSRAVLLRSAPSTSTLMPALLAAHAFEDQRSPEAYEVLRRTLACLPPCGPSLDHPYCVGAVCFSPDGRLVATAAGMSIEDERHREYTRSARGPNLEDVDEYSRGMQRLRAESDGRNTEAFDAFVWVAATGERCARLRHRGRVRAMAFLPDGAGLVTACDDGEARVWSVEDGQQPISLPHPGPSWFVAVSPDGSRALTVADDGPDGLGQMSAHVWSIADAREQLRLPLGGMDSGGSFLRRELTAFAACPRLECLATAFVGGSMMVLSLVDGSIVKTDETESHVYALAFSADGRQLAVGGQSQARILNAADYGEVVVLPHTGAVEVLCWSPRGDRLVTARGLGTGVPFDIGVWRLDGSKEASYEFASLRDLTVSPDGDMVAMGGLGHTVTVWSLGRGDVAGELHFEGSVNRIAFSPDGTRIAAGSDDLSARVWEARFGLDLMQAELDATYSHVELSGDSQYVAVAGSSGCRLFALASGEWAAHHELDEYIEGLRWSPDGSTIALASSSGVKLWNWTSGASVTLRHEGLRAFAFGSDGSYLVTAGLAKPGRRELTAGAGCIWRTADGRLMAEVRHSDTAVAAAAHPDGVTFATAAGPYFGHGIVIFRASRGSDTHVEISEPANALAFSPDGKLLAVGYYEHGIGLFNTRGGRHIRDVGRPGEVLAVEFDPQGRFLAATMNRETYQAPRVATTEVFQFEACPRAGRYDKPDVVLPGESLVSFVDGSAFLVTEDGSSVHIRETGSWEVVCSFSGASAKKTFSFRNGLLARLESNPAAVRVLVSRWTPDALASEFRQRLPRDLSEYEWTEYMGSEQFRPVLE